MTVKKDEQIEITEELMEEYHEALNRYIEFFGEDPGIGCCTDVVPRPIPRLIKALNRAIARGSKLKHNEVYESGGWGSFRLRDKDEEDGVIRIKKKK